MQINFTHSIAGTLTFENNLSGRSARRAVVGRAAIRRVSYIYYLMLTTYDNIKSYNYYFRMTRAAMFNPKPQISVSMPRLPRE